MHLSCGFICVNANSANNPVPFNSLKSAGMADCKSYAHHYVLEERFNPPLVLFLPVLHFTVNWCGAPASILALTSL